MELSPIARQVLADLPLPARQWPRPVLIGIFGLPGTGKTEITRFLAARHPLIALSTDAIRLRYNLTSGPDTHAVMFELVDALLPHGYGVILDGIHLGRKDRDHVRGVAQRHGARCWMIYATTGPTAMQQRLEARRSRPAQTRAEGKFVKAPEHLAQIADYLEGPGADEDVTIVDTSHETLAGQLAEIERHLGMMALPPALS